MSARATISLRRQHLLIIPSYERTKLTNVIDGLVAASTIDRTIADRILACAEGDAVVELNQEKFSEVRKSIDGKINGVLSKALAGCATRG